jgi:hypothetical protein
VRVRVRIRVKFRVRASVRVRFRVRVRFTGMILMEVKVLVVRVHCSSHPAAVSPHPAPRIIPVP